MNRIITLACALFIGFFTLMFSLVMVVPLAIIALITGRKIERSFKQARFNSTKTDNKSTVLEGEFEDVSR